MILVTAAHGNQGKLLVPKLLAAGLQIRAAVQSDTSAILLRATGIEDVIVGDLSDPEVQRTAIRGVQKVYHVGADPCIRANARWGSTRRGRPRRRRRALRLQLGARLDHHRPGRARDQTRRRGHLLSSDLEFTILQPANYMLPLKLRPAFDHSVFELSWSLDRRQSLVDLDDLTDVAVMSLTDSARHAGATDGWHPAVDTPRSSFGAIIAEVLDRDIAVSEIDADTYAKAWLGNRDPGEVIATAHRAALDHLPLQRARLHRQPERATWPLQREPTTYQQFVRREWNAHQEAQS